jgi:hypothetical protein
MGNKSWIVKVGIYCNSERRHVGECCVTVVERVTRAPHRRAAVRAVDRMAEEHWLFDDECWLETISVAENINGWTNEQLAMNRQFESLEASGIPF